LRNYLNNEEERSTVGCQSRAFSRPKDIRNPLHWCWENRKTQKKEMNTTYQLMELMQLMHGIVQ
jgi:hypothetical protein